MTIKTKLLFSILATAILVCVAGVVIYQSAQQVGKEIKKTAVTQEIVQVATSRRGLILDYYRFHEERPKAQWQLQLDTQTKLTQAQEFDTPDEQSVLRQINETSEQIKSTFAELVANYEKPKSSQAELAISKELEQVLVSQLLTEIQTNITRVYTLSDNSLAKVSMARNTLVVAAGASMILLLFFLVALYFFFNRSIAKPLIELKEAAVRIASLDFSPTTTTTTTTGRNQNDEVGQIAGAFNKMAEKLKESYGSLEQKVSVKTQDLDNARIATQNVLEDLTVEKLKVETAKAKDEAILASVGDGVTVTDDQGKIIMMNKAAENMLGRKHKEILGKPYYEVLILRDEKDNIIPPEKLPVPMALSGTTTTTTTDTTSYYYAREDKTIFPVVLSVAPVILKDKIIGTVCIFRDTTKEKEIDKAKTEFVSLASHQLRTPLGIIKWYLEVLQKEDYLQKAPQQTKEYFDEIFKSNERVLSLVRDLLSVSRIEQGRVKDAPKPVNIPEIITDIVTQMQILAKSKKVTLHLERKAKKLPSMYLDPLRFNEVVENLVTNAIEYTPALGKVEIIVDINKDTVTVSIQDTGMGISVVDKSKLFDKFFRSQEAVKNNPEGSGLGLYVVKSYVEEWGGKISVESVEGKGSTFTISLPISGKKNV